MALLEHIIQATTPSQNQVGFAELDEEGQMDVLEYLELLRQKHGKNKEQLIPYWISCSYSFLHYSAIYHLLKLNSLI
jgi:hypothetical protein